MFKIQDGRENFVQWDLNRKIFVEDESITQVHFANLSNQNALVTEVKNHLADVPNVLLQDYGTILIYGCDGNYTKYSEAYRVLRREKPDNYVYTETEVLNYNNLLGRIDNLEGNIDQIIADYLRENPPQVDLSGYATKEYVDNAIAAIGAVDLSNYFTKEEANSKFATKEEIPSTVGLATEQYVNEAIAGIEIPEEIPHLTGITPDNLADLGNGFYYSDDYLNFTLENSNTRCGVTGYFIIIDGIFYFLADGVYGEYQQEGQWYLYSAATTDDLENYPTKEEMNTAISEALAAIGVAEGGAY